MSDVFILIHRYKERIYVTARDGASKQTIGFDASCKITKNSIARQYIPEPELATSSINLLAAESPLSFERYYCHEHIPNWYSIIDMPKDKNLVDVCFFADLNKSEEHIRVAAALMVYIIKKCKLLLGLSHTKNANFNLYISTMSNDNMQIYSKNMSELINSNLVSDLNSTNVNIIPLSEFLSFNIKQSVCEGSEGQVFLITDEDVALCFNEAKGIIVREVYKHQLLHELQEIIRAKIGFKNMQFSDVTISNVIKNAQLDFLPTLSPVDFSKEMLQLYKNISESSVNFLLPYCLESELFFKNITVLQISGIAHHLAESFAEEINERRALLLPCDKEKLPEVKIITYTPKQTATKLLELISRAVNLNCYQVD